MMDNETIGTGPVEDVMDFVWSRVLAKKDVIEVDYSILAVLVVTLGLVLVVELLRHQLDHYAGHRPLLHAVVQGVYSECEFVLRSLVVAVKEEQRTIRPNPCFGHVHNQIVCFALCIPVNAPANMRL